MKESIIIIQQITSENIDMLRKDVHFKNIYILQESYLKTVSAGTCNGKRSFQSPICKSLCALCQVCTSL